MDTLTQQPVKKRIGRPPGAKNRPKDAIMTADKLRVLYTRIEPILTADHKNYLNMVIEGKKAIDPVMEMQLMIRYLSIIATEAAEYCLLERRFGRDIADIFNTLRQSVKDLEEMNRNRAKDKKDRDGQHGMVDATRESSLALFTELGQESPQEATTARR